MLDGIADLEAPTRKNPSGEDIGGLADLEAPTRKHPSRPTRRRAKPEPAEPVAAAPDAAISDDAEPVAATPDTGTPRRRAPEKAARRDDREKAVAEKAALATSDRDSEPETARSHTSDTRRAEPQPSTETGYHRAVGNSRRGIAKWPIAVAAVLVLFALGGLGMVWANKALNAQAEAEANSCNEGARMLRVTTAPTIVDDVRSAANTWNVKNRPVYSHCITVAVTAAAPEDTLAALRKPDAAQVPGAWITPSATWPEKLASTNPERVSSTAKPLKDGAGIYYPYVVVGGEGVDEVQQRAAQQFRDYVREAVAR